MAKYSRKQKNSLFKKLKSINITNEKDILNLKVSELKKIKEVDENQNITINDIEIIWLMQEAIENKNFFEFIINDEQKGGKELGKIVETRELYKNTLKEITKNEEEWLLFLKSAAWQFKYSFEDKILIYAQNPNATVE